MLREKKQDDTHFFSSARAPRGHKMNVMIAHQRTKKSKTRRILQATDLYGLRQIKWSNQKRDRKSGFLRILYTY
jgi:hypothetical protein